MVPPPYLKGHDPQLWPLWVWEAPGVPHQGCCGSCIPFLLMGIPRECRPPSSSQHSGVLPHLKSPSTLEHTLIIFLH